MRHVFAAGFLSLASLTLLSRAAVPPPLSDAKHFVITEFGAKADGTTLNSAAIQKAIDAASAAGGGTVVVPAGTFLSGAIFLKPHVNLHLEKGAVLKGSEKVADYPVQRTRIEGHLQDWLPALINADGCDGLVIDGEGTLDGSGAVYWAAFRSAIAANRQTKNLDIPRPRLVFIQKSKDVKVAGLRFLDSGFWNLHVYNCDGVTIEGLNIRAFAEAGKPQPPSTDGVDVDSSRNVTIKGCTFYTNDDCIALKGTKGPRAMEDKDSPPVEHIRVTDCTFLKGGSFLTVGSEATIVRDVRVEHCKAEGPDTANMSVLRLKLRPDSPELYEDIHYDDITLNGVGTLVSVAPWTQYFDLMGEKPPTRTVRNISISNVKGTWGSFGSINGNAAKDDTAADVIEKLTFENIDLHFNTARANAASLPAGNLDAVAPAAALPKFGAMVKEVVFKNVKLNGVEYRP